MPGIKFSARANPNKDSEYIPRGKGVYLGPYDTVAELLAAVHAAQLVDHAKSWHDWEINVEERE